MKKEILRPRTAEEKMSWSQKTSSKISKYKTDRLVELILQKRKSTEQEGNE